jgi:Kef-type K+ transport system membrane component KefB
MEIGSFVLSLAIIFPVIHFLGFFCEKYKWPRLIGEIASGILLGPYLLGRYLPQFFQMCFGEYSNLLEKTEVLLSFTHWVGLFLLMFLAGSETRKLLSKDSHRHTAWLLGVGTPLPFFLVLGLGFLKIIPVEKIATGPSQSTSALLILSISVAVTSIPVISRIFDDLKILHTRFAALILGSAVLEDIILWGVLAIATGLSQFNNEAGQVIMNEMSIHLVSTSLFMILGLVYAPRFLKWFHHLSLNIFVQYSPLAYVVCILFFYIGLASILNINLVFSAFLAGFGIVGGVQGSERHFFRSTLDILGTFGRSLLIPFYFFFVGYKLVWGNQFSLMMFLIFLLGSTLLSLICVGLAAWLAGFRKLDILNLAITNNARGGPGIVLATVAYEAGIINGAFYTTLVLTAVVTSQMAGSWLRFVISRGLPLLSIYGEDLPADRS